MYCSANAIVCLDIWINLTGQVQLGLHVQAEVNTYTPDAYDDCGAHWAKSRQIYYTG